jgi:hypothetical protein
MGNTESNPQKERLASLRRNETNCFIGNQISGMTLFVYKRVITVPTSISVLIVVRVLIKLPVQVTVGLIKSILARPNLWSKSKMPLPQKGSLVPAGFENAGERWRA